MKFLSAKRLLIIVFALIASATVYIGAEKVYAEEQKSGDCTCYCSTDGHRFYSGSWGSGTGCRKSCRQC